MFSRQLACLVEVVLAGGERTAGKTLQPTKRLEGIIWSILRAINDVGMRSNRAGISFLRC